MSEKTEAKKEITAKAADVEAMAGITALVTAIFAADEPAEIVDVPQEPKGEKKEGGLSFRADSCVREYRFIIVEFDHLKLSEQLEILRGLCRLDAKIAAIIYSGGKSFHAWLRCEGVTTAEEWQAQVKDGLFSVLTKLGADPACKNPSRLSRLPGMFRADKSNWQRLLYLAPEGGTI